MTPKRPYRLNFIGTVLPDGRPERYLEFMPVDENGTPRNLTAEETDELTQEQLRIIRQNPDLYSEVSEPKRSTTRSKASTATEPETPASEPDTGESAPTEGEGES